MLFGQDLPREGGDEDVSSNGSHELVFGDETLLFSSEYRSTVKCLRPEGDIGAVTVADPSATSLTAPLW
jgi:hypothetical protein